jgi:hypothetical protein
LHGDGRVWLSSSAVALYWWPVMEQGEVEEARMREEEPVSLYRQHAPLLRRRARGGPARTSQGATRCGHNPPERLGARGGLGARVLKKARVGPNTKDGAVWAWCARARDVAARRRLA